MRSLLAVVVLAVALSLLVGCAGGTVDDQRQALRNAADSYATAVDALADARTAGELDEAACQRIGTFKLAARQALEAWREAVDTGQPPDTAIEAFRAALRAMIEEQLRAEAGRKP